MLQEFQNNKENKNTSSGGADRLVTRTLNALKKEYVLVGKTHVRVWHAWLGIGVVAGLAVGIVLVSNRTGRIEATSAASLFPPSSLAATAVSSHQVNLTWADTNSSESGYAIERSVNTQASFSKIATVVGNATSYHDTSVASATTYYYRVRAYYKKYFYSSTSYSAYSSSVNVTTPSTITVLQDSTSPSRPIGFSATAVSTSQINLSWSVSTDPIVAGQSTSGLAGYKVFRSGIQIATVLAPTTTHANIGLTASTTYSYTVAAYDNALPPNVSLQSDPVSATTFAVVDTSAPTAVSIASPSSGTTYTNAQTVTITALASDNVGVTKVEFYDGTTLKGTDTNSSDGYSVIWSVTPADNGMHSWTAKAYDVANNNTLSSPVFLTVTIPASTKFQLNDRVQTTANVNVRATPGISDALLGTQLLGALGTIIGGPTFADSFWWWNVNYDADPDGWSVEDFLTNSMLTISRNLLPTASNPFKAGDDAGIWTMTIPSTLFLDANTVVFHTQVAGEDEKTTSYTIPVLKANNVCDTSGNCRVTGTWSPLQLVCQDPSTPVKQTSEWVTVGSSRSNTLQWYFRCSNISENFDAVPFCSSVSCQGGSSVACLGDFGAFATHRVDGGGPQNMCVADSGIHGGAPGSGHIVLDTQGTAEILYTKNDVASRNQTAEAMFRFDGGPLLDGTHLIVGTHARFFQDGGFGFGGRYNYAYAVGAGVLGGTPEFFLENLSGATTSFVPYNFKIGIWYKVSINTYPDPANSASYRAVFTAWEYNNGWQQVAQGSASFPAPNWLGPLENGGGVLGAVVNSNHIDFDQFTLVSH